MKNKEVLRRHKFYTFIVKIAAILIGKIGYGFKLPKKYKIGKDENVFVISNHQANLDPAFVGLAFNKPLYYVATDTITTTGFIYKLIKHALNPIPKKKGASDPQCVRKILKISKEGGSICLFVEGNRSYAEFQYAIEPSIVKLIRKLNIPIILYNIKGGNGVDPRFAVKPRKGSFTGEVKRRIDPSEYALMSDTELLDAIKEGIRVYDSESGCTYRSRRRAEYLERMFFVCPKCYKTQTLVSKGNTIKCSECSMEIEYTEDLKLKPYDKSIKFERMIDWYDFQKKWVKDYEVGDGIIFDDGEVELYSSIPEKKRKLISTGKMSLTKDELKIGEYIIDVKTITMSSPINGRNIGIETTGGDYLIKGYDRFNPLKYVLMFNRLDTIQNNKNLDVYFTLD